MTAPRQALPVYGRNLLSTVERELIDDCVVFCAPEAWSLVETAFSRLPAEVVVPDSMEQSRLEARIARTARARAVFGIGGGSACDAAKMYAWRTGAKLVLMPSILSVDAAFTKAVGVRVNDRVRYVGEVFPRHLLVDFDLVERAPKPLNRAGIGDILSIHTALWDWRLAEREIGERFDATLAEESGELLDRMFEAADDIRECNEAGIRLLGDLYVAEVCLCEMNGNSRPEEGSEHYFAYCLESITRRHFIHGELIALAVLLTSLYQEQPVERIVRFLDAVRVSYRPEQVGVTDDEIVRTLVELPGYLREETQLLYGVYHYRGMDEPRARALLAAFHAAIAGGAKGAGHE
ncbi:MAG: iron-containing alcohol dehydrogenase [Deltaproteobacteria bacterium]|nr:iron-containing alcohol dehydrogenase [Deltaproteobacteria bacterium]